MVWVFFFQGHRCCDAVFVHYVKIDLHFHRSSDTFSFPDMRTQCCLTGPSVKPFNAVYSLLACDGFLSVLLTDGEHESCFSGCKELTCTAARILALLHQVPHFPLNAGKELSQDYSPTP